LKDKEKISSQKKVIIFYGRDQNQAVLSTYNHALVIDMFDILIIFVIHSLFTKIKILLIYLFINLFNEIN